MIKGTVVLVKEETEETELFLLTVYRERELWQMKFLIYFGIYYCESTFHIIHLTG